MKIKIFSVILVLVLFVFPVNFVSAHCDTMDGPTVVDAKKAIEKNNVNYVLKWVQAADEKEIIETFELTMKVRVLSPEAEKLADKYFFETLVRIHRSGEGVPFTGVKPSGTPIDEKILAADKSISLGNLSPLNNLVPKEKFPELQKRFDKVMSLKNFDVNNVQAGREYIEAYVQFFHFAEGEEGHNPDLALKGEHNPSHTEESGHLGHISWILTGIFFITTIVFGILYYRKKNNESH